MALEQVIYCGIILYKLTIFLVAFEEMSARQNTRLTKAIRPDLKEYEETKAKLYVLGIVSSYCDSPVVWGGVD